MKIFEISDIKSIKENKQIGLCLGYFDGVHLGHQKLINTARKFSRKIGVLTFDNSPAYLLNKKDIYEITPLQEKIEILKKLNVEYLYIIHLNKNLLNMSHSKFVDDVLKSINPCKIYCGCDYKFGKKALGNVDYLKKYFDVKVVPFCLKNNVKISSRNIRKLLVNGEIKNANKLLGRSYKISGKVIKGNQIGKTLGFPTANIENSQNYIIPKNGVYAGHAYLKNIKYKCLISIGNHPTIKKSKSPIVEVYLLNFNKKIYNKELRIEFITYLRDIVKFSSTDLLAKQINKDVNFIKNNLK